MPLTIGSPQAQLIVLEDKIHSTDRELRKIRRQKNNAAGEEFVELNQASIRLATLRDALTHQQQQILDDLQSQEDAQ